MKQPGRPRKYGSTDERKKAARVRIHEWRKDHPEKVREQRGRRRLVRAGVLPKGKRGAQLKYRTDEERHSGSLQVRRAYRIANREKRTAKKRELYQEKSPRILALAQEITAKFESMKEGDRYFYAAILLAQADQDGDMYRAITTPAVDYHWLGAYASA